MWLHCPLGPYSNQASDTSLKINDKTNLVILTFLALSCCSVQADSPRFSGDTDQVELKVDYRGDDTPDGIIFQSLIRRVTSGYQTDPDRALRKVKREMAVESDDNALKFIRLLEIEHKKLSEAKIRAEHTFICSAQPGRKKSELFRDLDTLTGVEIELAAFAYDEFSASLSPDKSFNLDNWIQETKAGFRYFVTSAEQMTEKMGLDAVTHYEDKCIKIEQKLARMESE